VSRAVLVSGVATVIGYGIVRSLKLAYPDLHITGTDIHSYAVGRRWCDEFSLVPLCASPDFPRTLLRLAAERSVVAVFSGVPHELSALDELRHRLSKTGASVILNSPLCLKLGLDKWRLYKSLIEAGVPAIETRLVESHTTFDELASELGCPFMVKPRAGMASKGLSVISAPADFLAIAKQNGLMAQKIVGNADSEYTVGAYSLRGHLRAMICMRRWLGREGNTIRAEIVPRDEFEPAVSMLCRMSQADGPTNFQFRRHEGKLYLLEINPRFSSSSYMRTLAGYNEPAMAFRHYVDGVPPDQPPVEAMTFVRYAEDVTL
jgi:carbamoyl-phosphate synthase large subunit